jgi:hypothetical protein
VKTDARATARQSGGRIRRLFRHDDFDPPTNGVPSALDPRQADVIHIRPISEPDIQTLYFGIERLEAGVRLIVETMKRTHAELARSIESLAARLDADDVRTTVERIVAEEAAPLVTSVRQLSDEVQRFPHVLAAAMDDIGGRIDTGRWRVERTLAEAVDGLHRIANAPDEPLTPRPFELETVD